MIENDFETRAMRRSALAASAAQCVQLGLRFAATPWILASLGLELWTLWALLFLVLGWMGLQRVGFQQAAVALASRAIAEGDLTSARRYFRAAGTASLLVGVVAAILIQLSRDGLSAVLGVPSDHASDFFAALSAVFLLTAFALAFGGHQSSLEARNAFPRIKAVETAAALIELFVAISLLIMGYGIFAMVIAYGLRLAIQTLAMALLSPRFGISGYLGPSLSIRELRGLGEIFRFGLALQGLGFAQLSVGLSERLFLIQLGGLRLAGSFEIGRKLTGLASNLITQGLAPIAPAIARISPEDSAERRAILDRAFRWTLGLGLPAGLMLVLVAEPLLKVWLGDPPEFAVWTLGCLALAMPIHLATGPWTAAWRGLRRPGPEFSYLGIWLVILALGMPCVAYLSEAQNQRAEGLIAVAALAQVLASLALLAVGRRKFGAPRLRPRSVESVDGGALLR